MPFWKKSSDESTDVPDVPGLQDLAAMDVTALMHDTRARAALPVFAEAEVTSVGDSIDNEHVGQVWPIELTVTPDDGDPFDVATSVLADVLVPSVGQRLRVSFHDAAAVAVIGPA